MGLNEHIKDLTYSNLMVLEHETAKLACKRSERFIEGFSTRTELIKIYNEFFGDSLRNEHIGLRTVYAKMKEKIVRYHLIGIVLIGLDMDDIFITNYTALNFITIKLTTRSISKTIIDEVFTKDEVIELCKATPNYDIYVINQEEQL